jgi:hypothetical protein
MPNSAVSSSSQYEALFHASSVDLVVPEISSLPAQLLSPSTSTSVDSWVNELDNVASRDVAFLGMPGSLPPLPDS